MLALCETHNGVQAGRVANMLCLVDDSVFDPPSWAANSVWLVGHNDPAFHRLVFRRNLDSVLES